jgi:hypothetical protein
MKERDLVRTWWGGAAPNHCLSANLHHVDTDLHLLPAAGEVGVRVGGGDRVRERGHRQPDLSIHGVGGGTELSWLLARAVGICVIRWMARRRVDPRPPTPPSALVFRPAAQSSAQFMLRGESEREKGGTGYDRG